MSFAAVQKRPHVLSLWLSFSVSNFLSFFFPHIQSPYQHFGQSYTQRATHTPQQPSGLFQPFPGWLTEIPEIQMDGSSPWLMMSQADPFQCPLRSHSNPPQFPYGFHDKSHHAFLLTLFGLLIHFDLSPPEPGFGQTGGGFGRVNKKLRGAK